MHERFTECVHATELDDVSLTDSVLCIASQIQLSTDKCVNQCYSGALVMSGACSDVSARIKELTVGLCTFIAVLTI